MIGKAFRSSSDAKKCALSYIVGLDHVTIQIDEGDEALRDALKFYAPREFRAAVRF